MASFDKRNESEQFPMARYEFALLTFAATVTTAQTATLANVNGVITAIKMEMSETEDDINYGVVIKDDNSATVFSETPIDDDGVYWRDARSDKDPRDADFNPIPVANTLTLTVTPDNNPDNSEVGTKTATVKVKLYME